MLLQYKKNASQKSNLIYNVFESVFWVDLLAMLHMIKNANKHFPVFVANSLTQIVNVNKPHQSKFIKSKMNSADHASKGISMNQINSVFGMSFFLYKDE